MEADDGEAGESNGDELDAQDEVSSDENASDNGSVPTEPEDEQEHADDAVVAPTGYGRPPAETGTKVSEQAHLYPPREVGEDVITGVLSADADRDGGCLWLETDGEQIGLTWFAEQLDHDDPEEVRSYWARFYDDNSPAELVLSDGSVLAHEGDEIELAGNTASVEDLAYDGYELSCQLGDETLLVTHPDADELVHPQTPEFEEPGVDKVVQLARTYPGTSGGGDALVPGTLRADPDFDGGCFWLERDGEDLSIVWFGGYLDDDDPEEMHDYWGRFYNDGTPAEVVSTEGEVLAREGDEVEFGGGGAHIAAFDGYDLPCQVSDDDLASVYP